MNQQVRRRPRLATRMGCSELTASRCHSAAGRFTTIRSQFVDTLVSKALRVPSLQPLYKEIRIVGRIYAHDNATLAGFLTAIWKQLATQSVSQPSPDAQEDYCSKAFLCIMRSFISGSRAGLFR